MRKRELLIGAAALVIGSVTVTLYLVNHMRTVAGTPGAMPLSKEPDQVISPSDLFSSGNEQTTASESANTSTAPDSEQGEQTDNPSRPITVEGVSKVAYPAWKTSHAHVEQARAVTEPGGYIAPIWSPVALDLAFTREARNAVFLCGPLPGGTARPIINDAHSGEDYSWNPDGMSMRIRAADGQYDQVLITGERYSAANAPARVLVRDEKIYFVKSGRAGDNKEVQVSGPEDRFSEPRLSPDETRVVYKGAETGLYIAAVDGSGAINVGAGTNPSWLPDSSGIVYDQQVSDGRTVVDGDLWLAMADGSVRTNLTETPGIVELYPCLAPDGERIAFSAGGSIYVGKLLKDVKMP